MGIILTYINKVKRKVKRSRLRRALRVRRLLSINTYLYNNCIREDNIELEKRRIEELQREYDKLKYKILKK